MFYCRSVTQRRGGWSLELVARAEVVKNALYMVFLSTCRVIVKKRLIRGICLKRETLTSNV